MSNVICPNSIRYFTLAFFTKTIISLAFFLLYITRLISIDAYLHLEILCLFFALLFPTFKALEHLLKKCVIPSSWQKKNHPPCYTLYSCYFYISFYKHIFFADI